MHLIDKSFRDLSFQSDYSYRGTLIATKRLNVSENMKTDKTEQLLEILLSQHGNTLD